MSSNFEPGKQPAIFTGYVVRKWNSPRGTYASLVLDVPGERGGGKYDFRCFSDGPLSDIDKLQAGQLVRVTCSVDMECLRDKNKQDVKVDNYSKWVPALTIRSMDVAPAEDGAAKEDELKW